MTAALSLPGRPECTVDDLAGRSNDFRYELVNGRLLGDRTPAPVEDAVLVVEIISKENTLKEIREKQRGYARAGVPHYWVINPLYGPVTLTELVLDPDRPDYQARAATSGGFETDRPWPVRLDLPALTRRYERLLAGARGVPASG